jgi:RNA polymerase subunit RPABC4/transcription elongation factor Spt4
MKCPVCNKEKEMVLHDEWGIEDFGMCTDCLRRKYPRQLCPYCDAENTISNSRVPINISARELAKQNVYNVIYGEP